MAKEKFLAEVRVCPLCEMAAHRVPENDLGKQLAFQCDNFHKIFLTTTPSAKKAIVVKGHTVEAVLAVVTPVVAKPKAAPKKLDKDSKPKAKPKAKPKTKTAEKKWW